MDALKLNRRSWLVRAAYATPITLGDRVFGDSWSFRIPRQTSVCAFFWRLLVWAPVAWTIGLVIVTVLGGLGAVIYPFWLLFQSEWTSKVRGRIADAVDSFRQTDESRVISAMLRAKRKVCPLIDLD